MMRSTIFLALVVIAGCQQPVRRGALGEPCLVDDALQVGCLAGQCNIWQCSTTFPTACGGTTGPCDIGAAGGCAQGSTCRLAGATTQCQAFGEGLDGDECFVNEDCGPGHYCNPFSGYCRPQCCADADCPLGETCRTVSGGERSSGQCVGDPCDAFSGGGCLDGAACYAIADRSGNTITACFAPGTLPPGSPCGESSQCQPGLACSGGLCIVL